MQDCQSSFIIYFLFSQAIHTSNVSPQTTTELEGSEGQAATASAVNPLQQTPSTLFAPSIEGDSAEELRAKAILRNVAISPRKLNDFVRILRGLSLEDALIQCQAHHKKSAGICAKVLKSAAANAVNNHGLDGGKLAVEEVWVGKGQYYKRVSMHAKGRSGIRHKYHSHLTIVLKEVEGLRRRTRVIPMLPERKKWQNLREKDVSGRESKRWWTWFPQNERPAGLSNAE